MKFLLLLPLLAFAQNPDPGKCTVSGAIVDGVTGQPISRAEIEIDGIGDDSIPTPYATSDAKGNFTILNLPPGQYRLKGHRNGYLETYYGARRAESNGTPIRLDPSQKLDGLVFKMLPFGVIAGAVRDQDGEPQARANIALFRLRFEDGRRRLRQVNDLIRTDDLGQYRVPGLPPGRYYVRAEPEHVGDLRAEDHSPPSDRPREVLLSALYPGVVDPAAARPVEVTTGARVTGIDITLPRSTTVPVTGHVSVAAGIGLRNVILHYASEPSGGAGFEFEAKHLPNGDFVFLAVPPGSYVVSAVAQPPRPPSSDFFEMMFNQPQYAVRAPLQVGGTPVENVRLALAPATEVSGHVTVEGEKDPNLQRAELRFVSGSEDETRAMIHPDLFFGTALGPGRYVVDWSTYTGYVLHSVRLEGKDITADGFTVSGGGKLQLDVTLGKDVAELEGAVTDKDGKPAPGATVVLVPEAGLRAHPALFRHAEADQSGRFQFKVVPPGSYTVFAWDDVEAGIWWDPEFLKNYESKGVPVTLKPNGHETAKVKLIAE